MKTITLIENNGEVGAKVGAFPEEINSVVLSVSDEVFEVIMLEDIKNAKMVMNFLYSKFDLNY